MNDKTKQLIEAARARTAQLLAEQSARQQLPSSASLQTPLQQQVRPSSPATAIADDIKSSHTLTKLGMLNFDPFDIPGVGRANEQQAAAITKFGLHGESGCLIGPAGTGKTTTMRAMIHAAIMCGRLPMLDESMAHKYLRGGVQGIYGGSFTRIATRNLRNNFPPELQCNVHTLHRLLEFEPEVFEVDDPANPGKTKFVRLFKPTRNKFRSLDPNLVMFCLDESSMIGYTRLHASFIEAIHPSIKNPQIIYIGDIAQIPPVMDDAVLGYKMLEFLPKGNLVELTQVYRHAGAIVNLATRIRSGVTFPASNDVADLDNKRQYPDNRYMLPYINNPRKLPWKYVDHSFKCDGWNLSEDKVFVKEEDGSKVTIKFWKKRLDGEVGQLRALQNLGIWEPAKGDKPEAMGFFIKEIEAGNYDPLRHMILIPYNKAVGSIELNKYIANYLGRKRSAEVHEIIAGSQKHYLAVGDKIYVEREEAVITKITRNSLYGGREPQKQSIMLDRWGHNTSGMSTETDTSGNPLDELELLLNINIGEDDEERKNQASHHVYYQKIADMDDKLEPSDDDFLSTAAEFNSMGIGNVLFSYALTIHKSQGSQWEKVYCVFHNSHNRNLQRELLYTAITRAQKELFVIAEPETFVQGVLSQHIVGDTLAEKAEYFKGKIAEKKDLLNG